MQKSIICQGMLNSRKWLLLSLALMHLTGCANVAMSSAQAVYNHHSIERNVTDQYNTMRIYQAMYIKSDDFKETNISIASQNNEILLAGQVPNEWQRKKAEEIARKLPNVKTVYNLITLSNPTTTLTKMSDAWITAKVKAKLISANEVDATQVKVVTENGTVYLMGVLQPNEAQEAVELARTTAGVRSVVKMFSYMHINKNLEG